MWNGLVEGGPANLDALGGQQAAVAVVTEQDQFLTLCGQTLQTPISADGQPDDLRDTHTHTRAHTGTCNLLPCSSPVQKRRCFQSESLLWKNGRAGKTRSLSLPRYLPPPLFPISSPPFQSVCIQSWRSKATCWWFVGGSARCVTWLSYSASHVVLHCLFPLALLLTVSVFKSLAVFVRLRWSLCCFLWICVHTFGSYPVSTKRTCACAQQPGALHCLGLLIELDLNARTHSATQRIFSGVGVWGADSQDSLERRSDVICDAVHLTPPPSTSVKILNRFSQKLISLFR